MGVLWDRVEERPGGAIVRSNGAGVAEIVTRLERGESPIQVGDELGLTPAELLAALAHAGLGSDGADGPTLTQVPPGRPRLLPALGERALAELFPDARRPELLALAAGLLQVHDEWGPSHEAAQEADNLGEVATTAFWHGIAHRREPDPGNASYWFRRVARDHPAFAPLAASARPLLEAFGDPAPLANLLAGGGWNPSALIDLCTRSRPGTPAASLARKLQRLEMIALLEVTAAPCPETSSGTPGEPSAGGGCPMTGSPPWPALSNTGVEEVRMALDERLVSEAFPLASRYHPEWIMASVSGGAHSLWLAEWLAGALDLRPGMRVLDLGCGRAASSIFLRREFGVQVWATDLWFSASENHLRIRDAGVEDGVFPIRAEARSLPFAEEFFDAIVSIDSFPYYGTDDLYLNDVARFVKPGGQVGIAGAGLMREIEDAVPEHLRAWWTPDLWALHSAPWWRRHWERTGLMDVELADAMPDGWRRWLDWHRVVAPDNEPEIRALEADRGAYLGYVRLVGRRRPDAVLSEPILSLPRQEYAKTPLFRGEVS